MCTPHRVFSCVLATALIGCGGGLSLPTDNSPTALRVESGDGQQGTVGSRLDQPLVVRLTDASSQPIAGVTVLFQFTTDAPGAEVDPEVETDSSGLASAEVRLGSSTGSHQVEAHLAAAAQLRTTFVVTAVERDRGKKDKGDDHEDDDDD